LAELDERIADLDREITQRARKDETSLRLMAIPGIGPISATALIALAPAAETFAAWPGLAPLQRSTGGKQKLSAISKMGECALRRLLIIGGSSVVHRASRRGAAKGSSCDSSLEADLKIYCRRGPLRLAQHSKRNTERPQPACDAPYSEPLRPPWDHSSRLSNPEN